MAAMQRRARLRFRHAFVRGARFALEPAVKTVARFMPAPYAFIDFGLMAGLIALVSTSGFLTHLA